MPKEKTAPPNTIYILNGWTDNVGQWELEAYSSPASAILTFDNYVRDYNATPDYYNLGGIIAQAECKEGSFWIEEVKIH